LISENLMIVFKRNDRVFRMLIKLVKIVSPVFIVCHLSCNNNLVWCMLTYNDSNINIKIGKCITDLTLLTIHAAIYCSR